MQPENYDVVVVGSGIGGLSAGALLAHAGYKTLVVESLSRIGGRCSTVEWEGFKLPTGALAIHRGDEVDEVFKRVGAEIELINVPPLFYRLTGRDYEMPPKGSISTMLGILSKLEVDRAKLIGGLVRATGTEKIMGAFRGSIREPGKEQMTFKEWLLQYTDNELAHDMFDTIACTLMGCHTYEIPASAMFTWFAKMGGARDVGVAPRGNLINMKKLAGVVEKNGDVWTDCSAKRILVGRGTAQGVVVVKDGSEVKIPSKAVVSNAGPKRTVELTGEENFDESYLRMLRLRHRPHPCVMCFVASGRPLWPEDGLPAILMLTGTRRIKSIVPISSIAPELAPPGQHLLFGLASPVSSEVHINVDEEMRQVTLDLKEQLPGFEKYGRILKLEAHDINDPFTDAVVKPSLGMPPETPVKSLYNVGDSILSPGLVGTTGAVESSFRVVEMLRKSLK